MISGFQNRKFRKAAPVVKFGDLAINGTVNDIAMCGATPLILSGTIADHGITILTRREGLSFESDLTSDTAPLNHMVKQMFAASNNIHVLRDPTRGGVGTALNEIAEKSQIGIKIYEDKIPLKKEVAAACELLGFDPLYLANEGKLLSFVAQEDADAVLSAIRANQYGKDAAVIGEVIADHTGKIFYGDTHRRGAIIGYVGRRTITTNLLVSIDHQAVWIENEDYGISSDNFVYLRYANITFSY